MKSFIVSLTALALTACAGLNPFEHAQNPGDYAYAAVASYDIAENAAVEVATALVDTAEAAKAEGSMDEAQAYAMAAIALSDVMRAVGPVAEATKTALQACRAAGSCGVEMVAQAEELKSATEDLKTATATAKEAL